MHSTYQILMCMCMLMIIGTSCGYRITDTELRKSIDASLPKNTDKETVLAFLEAKKIEHSGYLDNPEKESDFTESRLDRDKDNIHYYIVSIIRDVKKELFSFKSHSLQIYFYFDNEGRLVRYSIREVITSM